MYELEEMSAWTPDEVLVKIRENIPSGWGFHYGISTEDNWVYAIVKDSEGVELFSETQGDPKILFLDLLGWLMLRGQKAQHPAWQRRSGEVNPNKRETRQPKSSTEPEPADLDPVEVAEFFKKHEDEL